MFALIKRYRELIVVSALVLYPFITFMARGRTPRQPNFLDRAVLAVTAPIQRGLGWTIDGVVAGWDGYLALRGVKEQHDALLLENAELRARVNALSEAELQNGRLRQLLGYVDASPGAKVAARVIGVNPDARLLSVRLDRGADHGVSVGAAVITADGVVGQVIRVTGGYSDVMLVKDPSSRVAARVQRTRARATLAGLAGDKNLELENERDQNLMLENVLRTEDVQEGDVIITAGTDGVFPAGLVVGKVTRVEKKGSGMFQSAEVVPAVDLSRVEEVLVLPPVEWTSAQGTAQLDAQKGTAP